MYCPCFIEGIHLVIRSGLPEQVVKFKLSMLSTLSYYIRNQIYLIVPLKNIKMLLVQTMFIQMQWSCTQSTTQCKGWIRGQALVNSNHSCEPNSQLNSKRLFIKFKKASTLALTKQKHQVQHQIHFATDLPFGGKYAFD